MDFYLTTSASTCSQINWVLVLIRTKVTRHTNDEYDLPCPYFLIVVSFVPRHASDLKM